jgi:hypothetical protein
MTMAMAQMCDLRPEQLQRQQGTLSHALWRVTREVLAVIQINSWECQQARRRTRSASECHHQPSETSLSFRNLLFNHSVCAVHTISSTEQQCTSEGAGLYVAIACLSVT